MKLRNLLFVGIGLFVLSSLTKNIFEFRKNYLFYNSYKEDYLSLKKEHVELKTRLVKAQDMFEFEKHVRNDLNYHQPDEYIVILPEPTPTVVTPSPTTPEVYKQWMDAFGAY